MSECTLYILRLLWIVPSPIPGILPRCRPFRHRSLIIMYAHLFVMKTEYSIDPEKQTDKQTNTTTIIVRLSPSSNNNNDN